MSLLPEFGACRVLVAGDVMLDRYWLGSTSRISPEAPVPVVHVKSSDDRAGGAANVAINLAALGVNTALSGVIGDDEAGRVLSACLQGKSVNTSAMVTTTAAPTITKLRVLSRNQQLIRLDFEEAPADAAEELANVVERSLADIDVLVLSDYAKGALGQAPAIIAAARARGIAVVVDPKGTDFTRYAGATVLTPNRSEFEAVVGQCKDEAQLLQRGRELCSTLQLEALLVTRSEEGMSLILKDAEPVHLPTEAREVFDVTGAGDTVVAALAAGLAAGVGMVQSARLANLAAGVVVAKLGTASVSPAELARSIRAQHMDDAALVSEADLLLRVAEARAHGERVVMTNGCFDVLHPGHVAYLAAARELGDCLIVAVNDDDSVRGLKGPTRPINLLGDRMTMLAALQAVDLVVSFAEQTPERLICAVKPDVLVKGGDYRPEQVAGGQCAGEVRIIEFVDGYSTSNIVRRIRNESD